MYSEKEKLLQYTNDLNVIKDLIESKKIKPVIGKRFPLEDAAEAHTYVDTGHKVGSAVITITP